MTSAAPLPATAALVLADGSVFWGKGVGAPGTTGGEVCFNTSMTGYQEIMTDPSYAGQIITFTFPHIGNVGANGADNESTTPFAKGLILRTDITAPSSHRAEQDFNAWLTERGLTGICGLDTRALTRHLREKGAQNGIISFPHPGESRGPACAPLARMRKIAAKPQAASAAHDSSRTSSGKELDPGFRRGGMLEKLHECVKALPDMNGLDIAKTVSTKKFYTWDETAWDPKTGAYGRRAKQTAHVVVVDYGVKRNILRCLAAQGFSLTVVPCDTPARDVLALKPDGIFLSNGPGDPAATGLYAVGIIRDLLKSGLPLFGICLGHQLLARALGGKTEKLPFGHRGANHPVKDLETGKVEITSQNHGFHVLPDSLPAEAEATHVSLFDGTNEGLRVKNRPVFSVQYHPEASPGPQDSHYLFARFASLIEERKKKTA